MKKILSIATVLIIAAGGYCVFAKEKFIEKPVSKNINVEVYKTSSYVSPVYTNTTATLQVTVVRVKNGKRDTAFQHTFQPTELKDFPGYDKPITQKISIPNVNDRKEKLEVYYKVTYNSQGSILNLWKISTIGQGQQTGKLHIPI